MPAHFGPAPSLADIETLARSALARLPEPFAAQCREIVLRVEDFADDDLLDELGCDSPFDLTGVYEGTALTQRSIEHSATLPPQVRLFRRAILDEWADGEETLEHLVAHVLIHEIGHHFGLSDADIHALEQAAD